MHCRKECPKGGHSLAITLPNPLEIMPINLRIRQEIGQIITAKNEKKSIFMGIFFVS